MLAVIVLIPALMAWPFVRAIRRRRAAVGIQPRIAKGGFPVITADQPAPAIPLTNDGPGRYKIIGVVASTGADTKMYIDAETLANAKVKAELRGVIVTDIGKA